MRSILLCIFISIQSIHAQIDVKISINGFTGDTIWIGKYYGKRLVKDQPILKSIENVFEYKSLSVSQHGLFNIVYTVKGDAAYRGFPIVINDHSKQFTVSCQVFDPIKNMIVTGSAETTLYVQYFNKMDALLDAYAKAADIWRIYQNEETFQQLYEIEKQINVFQTLQAKNNPGTFVTSIINMTKLNVPPLSGSLMEQAKRRQQYFDQSFKIEPLNNQDFWSCPLCILWLDLYAIRSHDTDIHAAIIRVKKLLDYLAPNEEAYHYYIHYLLNSFQRMSKNNMDQIYVSLVRDYVEKGKTPWMIADEINKHTLQANAIDRTRVGAKAPEITLFKEDNSAVALADIKLPYTLMIFWAPDCSHCKRELPIIRNTLDKYKTKQVQMVTICNKMGEALPACYEYLKANFPGTNWLNLGDKNNSAHASTLYNVTGTPCIYLLDAQKNIVYRRRGEMEDYEWDHLFAGLK